MFMITLNIQSRRIIYLKFSSNSEENASELIENLDNSFSTNNTL